MKRNATTKIISLILTFALTFTLFTACGTDGTSGEVPTSEDLDVTVDLTPTAEDVTPATTTGANQIVFSAQGATASGCQVTDNVVTVNKAGTYSVSGTSESGQLIVNADNCTVTLVFDGLNLTCQNGAPIFVQKADKVIITLSANTENYLTDTANYNLDESGEPTATVFSKSDLSFNGTGKLTIDANYNNAIQCKDVLMITGGVFDISSADDGVIGKDYLYLSGCTINLDAEGDGLRATNDTDATMGSILIESGNYTLTCGNDAIQAVTAIEIKNGSFDITTGGGSSNASSSSSGGMQGPWGSWGTTSSSTASSAKGIKASSNVTVRAGTFNISSSDDSLHSNGNLVIFDGTFILSSGDDGIHADSELCISGGTLTIVKSYEGIESASIIISGGQISVTASDDGINAGGGADSSSMGGRPGQNTFSSSTASSVNVSGGTVYLNSSGDGLDSNGTIVQSGGTIIVEGPTDSGNGAVDYQTSYTITGGILLAIGSSGMAQMPSSSSTQYSVMATVSSSTKVIHIENGNGECLLNFAPTQYYNNIVFSSPEIAKGDSIKILLGGSLSGNKSFGLYDSDCTYSVGTLYCTLTVNSINTTYGSSGGGGMGGMR